ncbi:MAG TPA: LysR substrate-binding domain-containing protein, partial [Paraburkholderia sp.]|nr:LysR substrate-binding domain-containing protein [Paraburkholderia sp.]
HGTPSSPDDLAQHETLRQTIVPDNRWLFVRSAGTSTNEDMGSDTNANHEQRIVELKGRFRGDDSEAVLDLALAGCGIALLPTWLAGPALREGRLHGVLPEWEARTGRAEPAIWAVYPPKKIVSSKVRAFVDFYAGLIGEPPYWDEGLAD